MSPLAHVHAKLDLKPFGVARNDDGRNDELCGCELEALVARRDIERRRPSKFSRFCSMTTASFTGPQLVSPHAPKLLPSERLVGYMNGTRLISS